MAQAPICTQGDTLRRAMLESVDAALASRDHEQFLKEMRAYVDHARVCDQCGIKADVKAPAAKME